MLNIRRQINKRAVSLENYFPYVQFFQVSRYKKSFPFVSTKSFKKPAPQRAQRSGSRTLGLLKRLEFGWKVERRTWLTARVEGLGCVAASRPGTAQGTKAEANTREGSYSRNHYSVVTAGLQTERVSYNHSLVYFIKYYFLSLVQSIVPFLRCVFLCMRVCMCPCASVLRSHCPEKQPTNFCKSCTCKMFT